MNDVFNEHRLCIQKKFKCFKTANQLERNRDNYFEACISNMNRKTKVIADLYTIQIV